MKRSRSFRIVRFVLLALLGVEVSYVAGANAFLSFGGVQKVLESSDDFRVTFHRAWTLWPGTIHVNHPRILFQDHNLEWSLDAERLDIDYAFGPILSKTLHATRVRGKGIVFRVRQRVTAANATLASTRALPPIPEFETPALVPAYVPAAPRTDLWRFHAEDVDVGVVEIWTQQFRYLGQGRARGAFRLHAGHHLWVGPATLELEPGEVLASQRVLAGRFFGRVECVVHPMFVNAPVGRELFRYVSAKLDLHAEDVRLEPLDLFLPGTSLSSPGARLDVALAADHGVLTPESRIELRGPELRGRRGDWLLDGGAFALDARTAPDGLGEARFRVQAVQASRQGRPGSRLTLAAGSLAFATSNLDISSAWGLARVDAALSSLEVPALVALDDLTRPHGVRLSAGSARLDASARHSASGVSGEGRALLTTASGRAGSVGWELDGSVELSLSRMGGEGLSSESLDLAIASRRLAIVASATRVEAKDAHVTARARLSHGRGAAQLRTTADVLSIESGPVRVTGKARAELELTAIDRSRETLHASAAGELASLKAKAGTRALGRARHLGFEAEGSLAGSKVSRGWLELVIRSLSVRTGDKVLATNAKLFAEAKDLDLVGRRGGASAVLRVRDFSLRDAAGGTKCQLLSVAKAALRSQIAFSPGGGMARVDLRGDVEGLRARWDDFDVSGEARLVSRYLESTDEASLDVVASKVSMTSGTSAVEGWAVTIPELRLVSSLRRDLRRLSGPVVVRANRVVGRIGRAPLHADLGAEVRLAALDLRRKQAIGSGSVRITNAGLDAGPERIDEWWGNVSVPLVSVVAGQNLDLLGDFRGQLRDGLPILALFADSGDLPGWVPELFPLHGLEVRGRFRRSCRTTDLVLERATGGPLALAGRIQSTQTDTRGAVLVQLQSPLALSAGLAIHDDGVGVSVLAGNDWLSRQSETLDRWELLASCEAPPPSCRVGQAETPH